MCLSASRKIFSPALSELIFVPAFLSPVFGKQFAASLRSHRDNIFLFPLAEFVRVNERVELHDLREYDFMLRNFHFLKIKK